MSHALITGGAGFIGSHLVDSLLADGWRVDALDNFDPFYSESIKRRNIAQHAGNPDFKLLELDFRERSQLEAGLNDQYDVVVHLAAKAGVRPSLEDPEGYRITNVVGSRNVFEVAVELGVPHFVFASSSSVYGVNPNVPWHEQLELQPISPYAETKIAGEAIAREFSQHMSVVALRFFTVYGPRQRPDLAIHKFARMMLAGETLPLFGKGDSRRDYTFIDDIIAGVRAAMDYRDSPFEIVNLGNNKTVQLLELVRAIETALDVEAKVEHLPEQEGDVPQTWASVQKAHRLLGYQPTTDIDEGLASFAEWLRAVREELE